GTEVDRRTVRVWMMPGGVDNDTVHKDVGLAVAGELVCLREVAVEAIRRIGIEERGDVLHDDGFRMHAAGVHVGKRAAVLRLEILLGAGIVLPRRAMVRDGDLRCGITS